MEESIAQPMTKERLMRYRSLRMENENQLERLARMKSGEQFPAMREGDGSQHAGAGDRLTGAVLRRMEYEQAREKLLTLHGVGPKVADCVLLFGCAHTRAFPVDVWMARAMERHFGMAGLSREPMREKAQQIFGEDAGLVQQYIFHAMRTGLAEE